MTPQPTQELSSQKCVQTWFIAFTSYRGRNPLYRHVLPRGFGHVFAFTRLDGGVLLLDPQEGGVRISMLPPPDGKHHGPNLTGFILPLTQTLRDLTLLEVPGVAPAASKHPAMFFPSCVTAIKAVLCRQSWALTPRSLFRHLQKMPGVRLLDKAALHQRRQADIAAHQGMDIYV